MKINFVNSDHVHALVDLPTGLSIEEMMQFFKGGSSHWINQNALVPGKFGWGRGYGVFSVSHSGIGEVAKYIAEQEEHHRKRSYADELRLFVERYELKWRDDKTVETRILHLVLRVLRNGSIWLSPEALVQAKSYAKKSAIVPRFALAVY